MKAIKTKYLPQTNTKDRRVKAYTHDGNQITVSCHGSDYNQSISDIDACKDIALALMDKMGWSETAEISGQGCIGNGEYVYTLTTKKKEA